MKVEILIQALSFLFMKIIKHPRRIHGT